MFQWGEIKRLPPCICSAVTVLDTELEIVTFSIGNLSFWELNLGASTPKLDPPGQKSVNGPPKGYDEHVCPVIFLTPLNLPLLSGKKGYAVNTGRLLLCL